MGVETLVVGDLQTNCYLVYDRETDRGFVIDPGDNAERILRRIEELRITIEMLVLTHFHFDHILAARDVADSTGAPIAIHRADAPFVTKPPAFFKQFARQCPRLQADRHLVEGDTLVVGSTQLRVLHTPGHSPGGISLLSERDDYVLTGDALFAGGVGRTDLPGSNQQDLLRGIRTRLLVLSDETMIYPGHGPSSTIGAERTDNPWLQSEGAR